MFAGCQEIFSDIFGSKRRRFKKANYPAAGVTWFLDGTADKYPDGAAGRRGEFLLPGAHPLVCFFITEGAPGRAILPHFAPDGLRVARRRRWM